MRKGGRVATAFLLAVAFCAAARGALAEIRADDDQDAYPGCPARPVAGPRPATSNPEPGARFLLFSTTDLWRQGGFAHGGLLWAPTGLDRDGPVLKLMFGGGIYHYISGALGNVEVQGGELAGAILPGWRFVRDGFAVTVFLGYDFQQHRLTPDDPSAGLRGSYIGARTGFDLWYQPTATTMVAADASLSTVGPSYNVRLATGLRALRRLLCWPGGAGLRRRRQLPPVPRRPSRHRLRTGDFEWSAGAGWATDTDDRSGAYGKLGVFTRR